MNSFFIDSTIWVEFFRGKSRAVNDFVLPLINEDRIYYNGIVLSELLIGANNEKEFSFIRDNFAGFKYLETARSTFEKASLIGSRLRKVGITIPLTDLIIAAHCLQYDLTLLTADPHFKFVNKKMKFKVEFLK